MNCRARIEHRLKYKWDIKNQALIVRELKRCADEYLSKPFDNREFIARVRPPTRRGGKYIPRILTAGNATLDGSAFETRYFIVELTAQREVRSADPDPIAALDRRTVADTVSRIIDTGKERGYVNLLPLWRLPQP